MATPRRSARLQRKQEQFGTPNYSNTPKKRTLATPSKTPSKTTDDGTPSKSKRAKEEGSKSLGATLIDTLVTAIAPSDKAAIASVSIPMILLFCSPMVLLTRSRLQMRSTILQLFNIFLRLLFPSAYFPATASKRGLFASPVTHRCIAFVAEFAFYEVWAEWCGVSFWGPSTYLWLMIAVNEVVSTTGVLLQMELLLFIEDSIWAIHSSYMCYFALLTIETHPHRAIFFGAFALALLLVHLPRRFSLLVSRGRAKVKESSICTMHPIFSSGVIIRQCEFEEKAWVVPMLLGMPLITALCYWESNGGWAEAALDWSVLDSFSF